MRIDPEGLRFASLPMAVSLILFFVYFLRGNTTAVIFAVFTLVVGFYVLYFFRDPTRDIPGGADVAISPADGVVVDISRMNIDDLDGEQHLRIAVFMNVFNVHVNRCPVAGTVLATRHVPGKKLNAMDQRAALENEHGDTDIKTAYGMMRIRQIAGLIARRVVTRVKSGDILDKGDRIGLIRFGSRVDVFLPNDFEAEVALGDKVLAGSTILAKIPVKTQETGK